MDLKGCDRQQFVGAALLYSLPRLSFQVYRATSTFSHVCALSLLDPPLAMPL